MNGVKEKPGRFAGWLWLTVGAVAMGYVECAVVVYLREIHYPDGFRFPLMPVSPEVMFTELIREAATLLMLAAFALLAKRRSVERLAAFIYGFAVWDICYYLFLKLMIGWPQSWLTWDILFLIPVTWVGPVLAPVINSVTMIIMAWLTMGMAVHYRNPGWPVSFMILAGVVITLIAYTEEYTRFMLQEFRLAELFSATRYREASEHAATFIPRHFRWDLFLLGEAFFVSALVILYRRNKKGGTKREI